MVTKVGVGKSAEPEPFKAGAEAAEAALREAGLEKCDFAFVFATVGYDQEELLKGVRSIIKDTPLIGCSAEGIITHEGPDENVRRIGVMVISSDEIKFTPVVAKGLKENSFRAGEEIGKKLNEVWPEKSKVLIMLPDGITVNADALFQGIESSLKTHLPFVGGTAGETFAFKQTYQYYNDQVLTDAASCVLLSGDFQFEIGVSHGARPIGIERTVTKAEGNHLYEIDNRPAFEIFKEFLGEEVNELTVSVLCEICLGVRVPEEVREKYEDIILKIPTRLDKKDNSLYMVCEWPVGTKIIVARRDPERIVQRAREVAEKIKTKIGKTKPKFILNFNCAARGKLYIGPETAQKEVKANQEPFGKDVPWLGWYTFGEIAPIGEKNYFHNHTGVLLVVY